MLSSHHNIRRPAFWLVLTCLASIAFFLLTDPRSGLSAHLSRTVPNPPPNAVDAAHQAQLGTLVGLAGSVLLLLIALFLCTRKGSPPTMVPPKPTK